jgi:hypothetical protein
VLEPTEFHLEWELELSLTRLDISTIIKIATEAKWRTSHQTSKEMSLGKDERNLHRWSSRGIRQTEV